MSIEPKLQDLTWFIEVDLNEYCYQFEVGKGESVIVESVSLLINVWPV